MKARVYLIICLGLLGIECKQDSIAKGTPDCVISLIDGIRNQAVWNPPARVYRYTYQGKPVYFVPQRCCDIPSTLYSESCAVLCFPDGGISGGGDGRCSDFFRTRTNETLIWKDSRK